MARRRSRRGETPWSFYLKLFQLLLVVAFFGAVGFYAYRVGQDLAFKEVTDAKAEIARLSELEATQASRITTLEKTLETALADAASYKARFEEVAPTPEMAKVMASITAKLAEGFSADRLAFVVQNAQQPANCSAATTKRFMVKVGKIENPNTWVKFESLVTVTAQGVGANDGTEHWFDAEKEITASFTGLDGKAQVVKSKLPIHHSMVVKDREFRFSLSPGQRGFVDVTGDSCDYRG